MLVDGKDARILYTPHFAPGTFADDGMLLLQEDQPKKKGAMRFMTMSYGEERLLKLTAHAEKEKKGRLLEGEVSH